MPDAPSAHQIEDPDFRDFRVLPNLCLMMETHQQLHYGVSVITPRSRSLLGNFDRRIEVKIFTPDQFR